MSIKCFGPGLKEGVAGIPTTFTVEMNGEKGALQCYAQSESQTKVSCTCTYNEQGSADFVYTPPAPGEYAIHVLCGNEDVSQSPFMAYIKPNLNTIAPSTVHVVGDGKWTYYVVLGTISLLV